LISGKNSSKLGELLAKKLEYQNITLSSKTFTDGETLLRFENFPDDAILVVVVQNLNKPQEFNLFQLLNIVQGLKRRNVPKIIAVTPYFCYARADREAYPGDIVSLQTVLKLIQTSSVDNLITIDIHNPNALGNPGFNVSNLLPSKAISNYFRDKYTIDDTWKVIAPDKGALYRAKALAEALSIPYSNLHKSRDKVTGEVSYKVQEIEVRKNVIIVDDITTSGASILKSNKILMENGAENVHVVISHLVDIKAGESISSEITGEMFSTTSFQTPYSKIEIADIITEEIRKFTS